MEMVFIPKIEDDTSDKFPGYIKEEEFLTDDSFSPIIKKEEENDDGAHIELLHKISLAGQFNQRFDDIILSLEQYLLNFVDVEDFILFSNGLSDRETQQIIREAQLHFKEWGIKIIRSLGEDLREKSYHHILPESHFIQLVEVTKRRIFNSYKQLKKNLSEIVSNMKQKTNTRPRKKIAKKKCDFPQRARALLKSWFIAHAQDPYPSHEEKIQLAREGGISMKQLENWLTNTRGRIWKKIQQEPKFDTGN